jgi:hypothetical protein
VSTAALSRRMTGIPSAAAAQTMAPASLPLRPSDGMTLPRIGAQRDDHPVDEHYGDVGREPTTDVQVPAATPAQAAQQAELAARDATVPAPDSEYEPAAAGSNIPL